MELEMEDLPSYTDVVKAEIHYFENINVWKEIVENCLQVNFVINCDMKEMKLTSDQLFLYHKLSTQFLDMEVLLRNYVDLKDLNISHCSEKNIDRKWCDEMEYLSHSQIQSDDLIYHK